MLIISSSNVGYSKGSSTPTYVFGRKGISYNMYINEGIIKGRTIVLEAKIVVPEP
jgi:hypothetical protein